ncbi:MAG: hypothetical protein ABEJ64_01025 [Candidatus Nanohaloarchaea archaeon]
MTELLAHHTHTPESNRTAREYAGVDARNHAGSYLELVEALDPGFDIVFSRTEHHGKYSCSDPRSYHSRLQQEAGEKGVELDYHDRHVTGELEGTRFAIIEGVEASYRDEDNHVTFVGVPVDEEVDLHELGEDEFYSEAEKASFVAPAHPFLGDLGFPREDLEELVDTAGNGHGEIELMLGYSTGYDRLTNARARGELMNGGKAVEEVAGEEVPVIPELDWHVCIPGELSGFGVLPDGSVDRLFEGDIPVENFGRAEVIQNGKNGISPLQMVTTYPEELPLYDRFEPIYRSLDLLGLEVPYGQQEFTESMEDSVSDLSGVTPEDVERHAEPLKDG